MKRWWLILALLLSLGANLGILLTLAVGRGGPGAATTDLPGRDLERPAPAALAPILSRVADRFRLEGERRERFLALQRRLLEVSFRTRRQRQVLERRLRRELIASEPDRERAEALVDELARTYRMQEKTFAEIVLDTRELLDPPQEREYLRFLARLRSHLAARPQPGNPRTRGPSRPPRPGIGAPPRPQGPPEREPPPE